MSDQEEEYNLLDFARAGELDAFKELFAKPNGVTEFMETRDEFTEATPLHMAAANGHYEVLKFIVENLPEGETRKTAVNAVNDSGNTPMHWAALMGFLDSVKLLVEAGADPLKKNKAGFDVCYQAESAGRDEVANYLCSVVTIDEEGEKNEN